MDISKKINKYLVMDDDMNESEDGAMAYLTAHPTGGRGRQGYRKGFCPHCGKKLSEDDK